MRLELEAIEAGRIVAGGDHHAADGAEIFHGEGNARRRRRFRREDDLEIVSGKNFGGNLRKTVGEKTAVVADNDFRLAPENFRFGISNFGFPEICRGLRDAGDVGKGKIFRDDRAPAVRAEFDLCHAQSLSKKFFHAKRR